MVIIFVYLVEKGRERRKEFWEELLFTSGFSPLSSFRCGIYALCPKRIRIRAPWQSQRGLWIVRGGSSGHMGTDSLNEKDQKKTMKSDKETVR